MFVMCKGDDLVRCAPTDDSFRRRLKDAHIPYYCRAEDLAFREGVSKFNFVNSPGPAGARAVSSSSSSSSSTA